MRIKSWALTLTWEDGTENDVSCYVPDYTSKAIEQFAAWWEERYGENDEQEDEQTTG